MGLQLKDNVALVTRGSRGVGRAFAFLASGAANYVAGAVFYVDGGYGAEGTPRVSGDGKGDPAGPASDPNNKSSTGNPREEVST